MIPLLLAFGVVLQLPDSARQARYERMLREVTDSLSALRGAAAAFRTDLSRTSSALILERATRVRNGCRGADAAVSRQQLLLAEGVYAAKANGAQAHLALEAARLRQALSRCAREWAVRDAPSAAAADSLAAWGPWRLSQLDDALRRFNASLRRFMRAADLKDPAVS
jgi:hypothetical protein